MDPSRKRLRRTAGPGGPGSGAATEFTLMTRPSDPDVIEMVAKSLPESDCRDIEKLALG